MFIGHVRYVRVWCEVQHSSPPYVTYTETTPAAQEQGLSVQRLRIMNMLPQAHFNHVLHSGSSGGTTDEAHRIWERLTEACETEAYSEDGLTRYHFSRDSKL